MSIEYCVLMYIMIIAVATTSSAFLSLCYDYGSTYLVLWVAMQLHGLVNTMQVISTYGMAARSKETVALTY